MSFQPFDLLPVVRSPGTSSGFSPTQPLGSTGRQNPFTGLTILSEVRGASIEFTQPSEEVPGENVMVMACMACHIYLVTKHHKFASGDVCFMTSIWAISDTGLRIQQSIPDGGGDEIIPYTVWGNSAKVIMRVPTELKFYESHLDSSPSKVAQTGWVSYAFDRPADDLGLWSSLLEAPTRKLTFP